MMKVVAVLCLLAAAAVQVYTMRDGAPSSACADITPAVTGVGSAHIAPLPYVNNSADQSMNPFRIGLEQFQCPVGVDGNCYVPGGIYQRKLAIAVYVAGLQEGVSIDVVYTNALLYRPVIR